MTQNDEHNIWEGTVTFTGADGLDRTKSVREEVLDEAKKLICGDREEQYGNPTQSLMRIARYWNAYLGDAAGATELLGPDDVAHMMILLKLARQSAGYKRDSEVDIAGYAAIAAESAERLDNLKWLSGSA